MGKMSSVLSSVNSRIGINTISTSMPALDKALNTSIPLECQGTPGSSLFANLSSGVVIVKTTEQRFETFRISTSLIEGGPLWLSGLHMRDFD